MQMEFGQNANDYINQAYSSAEDNNSDPQMTTDAPDPNQLKD